MIGHSRFNSHAIKRISVLGLVAPQNLGVHLGRHLVGRDGANVEVLDPVGIRPDSPYDIDTIVVYASKILGGGLRGIRNCDGNILG